MLPIRKMRTLSQKCVPSYLIFNSMAFLLTVSWLAVGLLINDTILSTLYCDHAFSEESDEKA